MASGKICLAMSSYILLMPPFTDHLSVGLGAK